MTKRRIYDGVGPGGAGGAPGFSGLRRAARSGRGLEDPSRNFDSAPQAPQVVQTLGARPAPARSADALMAGISRWPRPAPPDCCIFHLAQSTKEN